MKIHALAALATAAAVLFPAAAVTQQPALTERFDGAGVPSAR